MYIILDITTAPGWPVLERAGQMEPLNGAPLRIPPQDRPTVLQAGTEVEAKQEVARLLKASPKRTYGLFRLIAEATTNEVPWAVTLGGDVVSEVRVPKWEDQKP